MKIKYLSECLPNEYFYLNIILFVQNSSENNYMLVYLNRQVAYSELCNYLANEGSNFLFYILSD